MVAERIPDYTLSPSPALRPPCNGNDESAPCGIQQCLSAQSCPGKPDSAAQAVNPAGSRSAGENLRKRREMFGAGMLAVLPMLPGVAPFGIVAGLTAIGTGLSAIQAVFLSVAVFAGAAQLATLQLIGTDALPAVILLTALTINLRFAMYSASLAPHLQHLGRRWHLPLAYFLVDQNYAVSIHGFRYGDDGWRERGHWYYLGAGVALWLTWQASTAVGVFMAAGVPDGWSLDFAIPLVFLVLLVPALRNRAHVVAALAGGVIATVGADLPLHLGIVTGAFAGIAAGVVFERRAEGP